MLKRTLILGTLLVASQFATGCCCYGGCGWRPFWRRCDTCCSSSCYSPCGTGTCTQPGCGASPVIGDYSQPPAAPTTMPQSVPLTRR
jgi:hypothetical protein